MPSAVGIKPTAPPQREERTTRDPAGGEDTDNKKCDRLTVKGEWERES